MTQHLFREGLSSVFVNFFHNLVTKLYPLITYLKIPADKIFDPDYKDETLNLQKLLSLQKDCTEQESADLIPMVRYFLELLRRQN